MSSSSFSAARRPVWQGVFVNAARRPVWQGVFVNAARRPVWQGVFVNAVGVCEPVPCGRSDGWQLRDSAISS